MSFADRSAVVFAFAACLAPPLAVAEPAGAAPPIVERAIEHHGGDLYRASTTQLELCSKSGCSRLVATVDGDRFDLAAETATEAGSRRVRIANDSVEEWRAGEPQQVPEERRQALRDWVMARVYFPFLPYRLADPGVHHRELGIEEWDGRRLLRVEVTFTAGSSTDADDVYHYWFDPESGRLEQFAYSYSGNPGGLRFRRLENYRRHGGLLFADQINLGVEGPGLRTAQIDPQMVEEEMRKVSEIRLRDIVVEPLGAGR